MILELPVRKRQLTSLNFIVQLNTDDHKFAQVIWCALSHLSALLAKDSQEPDRIQSERSWTAAMKSGCNPMQQMSHMDIYVFY